MAGTMLNSAALLIALLFMAATSSAYDLKEASKLVMRRQRTGMLTEGPQSGTAHTHTKNWDRSTADQVDHYCKNQDVFGNLKDFPVAARLYRSFIENQDHSVFFAVGVNDGSTIKDLFANPWWDKKKVTMFGWEALLENYNQATEKLQGHEEVKIFHNGVSDKDAKLHLSGHRRTAGFYPPGTDGFEDAHEVVQTIRWDEFVKGRDLPKVDYALIDTEGHEMAVIGGMNLEKLKTTFPVFQYELGGTWVDARHAGTMTQEDAARYLEGLGYSIFLMGADAAGNPVLARMKPEAFAAAKCRSEHGKYIVQGNALAVLEEEISKNPWLKDTIDEMLGHDAPLSTLLETSATASDVITSNKVLMRRVKDGHQLKDGDHRLEVVESVASARKEAEQKPS